MVSGVKGETLSAAQSKELAGLVEKVKGFDAQLAKHDKDQALVTALKGLGSDVDQRVGGHLGMTGMKARSLAQSIAYKMRGEGESEFHHNPGSMKAGSPVGTKGLAATGSVLSGVPLVSSPLAEGKVALSLLDVLPHTVRPEVYKINHQTERSNNAAVVPVGGLKPTSKYGLESVEKSLKVIAHVSEPMDSYMLADGVDLARFVETEMLFGLRMALENQVLNGSGIDGEFEGILSTSGVQAQAFTTDILTTTRMAVTNVENAGYIPGVFAISPTDWMALELQRNTSGQFDLSNAPVDRAAQRLWGVPVVVTTALPAKTAVLLDLAQVGVDTDGLGVQVKWSESVGEDFAKNQIRARVEGRFGVSLYHPQSAVKIATAA
ncbi:MAG: phage major capsid protein [Rhodococcus sp. (in: high G+C Gram-positive bacteria)]|uniref:phage major capsid protein n=1 Tax=Rhodococcus sp. TaxID=1831 RepID=UPI002AD67025|nr:phage major capsid protein [Rhodococcus sp. (in: high G+C Gram-positive bacteria)]